MNNEELKKKICEIIAPYVSACGEDERIADALIAAGIGDVKRHRVFVSKDGKEVKQLYNGEEVEKIVKERDEYKLRAEVAESELERYTVLIKPLEAENARLNHLAARAKRALKDL